MGYNIFRKRKLPAMVRTPFPGMTDPVKLADYTVLNGTNIMTCVFFDFIILALIEQRRSIVGSLELTNE
jgi:hypothetical protein